MNDLFLQNSLDNLIDNRSIYTLLQPIVNLKTSQAIGYEALSRGKQNQPLQRPDQFFQAAYQFDRLTELEMLCIRTAVSRFTKLGLSGRLFVNISPKTLLNIADQLPVLVRQLLSTSITPDRLVIEISERYHIAQTEQLLKVLAELKGHGFQIAIDDLGAGYSGLKFWSEVQPDFVKIDRHFIDRIDQDRIKQAFVASVLHLCEQLTCEVIAEGIERQGEARLLEDMGVTICQGYLFGRPQSVPQVQHSSEPNRTVARNRDAIRQHIGILSQTQQPMKPNELLLTAEQRFHNDVHLMSIPVVENGKPVGILHRQRLLEVFAGPYGRPLYEKKSINNIMQSDPLIVDEAMPLDAVSALITDDDDYYLRQHLLITRNGSYIGMVNTKSLLKSITEAQIQRARYANPLTDLPGNVPIDEQVDSLISQHETFTLLYLDLNHFKPYNDVFGYQKGDRLLRWTGHMLQGVCPSDVFIGHIGGDDFVLIARTEAVNELCLNILNRFKEGCLNFYPEEAIARGFISAQDRDGNDAHFDIISLAIGVVPSSLIYNNPMTNPATLAALAKKKAKGMRGNAHFTLQQTDVPWQQPTPLAEPAHQHHHKSVISD